jgi:hypothetical protein
VGKAMHRQARRTAEVAAKNTRIIIVVVWRGERRELISNIAITTKKHDFFNK